MMEAGSRRQRTGKAEMSEKARGKRKAAETDDEGVEDEGKTIGERKRRRVTVRDLEETDWVKKVTGFMDRMAEWEERRELREARQEERNKKVLVLTDRMVNRLERTVNRMERLVELTKEVVAELREDGGEEPEDGNGGEKPDGEDDVDGEDEGMED